MKRLFPVLAGFALALSLLACSSPTGATNDTPFVGTSKYYIVGSVATYSTSMGINVSVLDPGDGYKTIPGATITVDGAAVPEATSNYYLNLGSVWTAGSSHTFVIKTPDGQKKTYTVVQPTGLLTGVTYNPAKPTIASSYVVSPPNGTWPSNAFVSVTVKTPEGSYYGYERSPTGSSALTVSETRFSTAAEITFRTSLRLTHALEGYAAGSSIATLGLATAW